MGERSTGEGRRQRNFCHRNDFVSVAPRTSECRQNAHGDDQSLTPGGIRQQGRPGLGQWKTRRPARWPWSWRADAQVANAADATLVWCRFDEHQSPDVQPRSVQTAPVALVGRWCRIQQWLTVVQARRDKPWSYNSMRQTPGPTLYDNRPLSASKWEWRSEWLKQNYI